MVYSTWYTNTRIHKEPECRRILLIVQGVCNPCNWVRFYHFQKAFVRSALRNSSPVLARDAWLSTCAGVRVRQFFVRVCYFGCFKGQSTSVQVLSNVTKAAVVLTLIILKLRALSVLPGFISRFGASGASSDFPSDCKGLCLHQRVPV